jgi:hypothetical protein
MICIPMPHLKTCGNMNLYSDKGWNTGLDELLYRCLVELSRIPTFDAMLQLQWYTLTTRSCAREQPLRRLQGLVSDSCYNTVLSSGDLYFVGCAESTAAAVQHLNTTSSLFRYMSDGGGRACCVFGEADVGDCGAAADVRDVE